MTVSPDPQAQIPASDEGRPYLSVVVAARNDDHGGDFLRRIQTFVNALAAQVAHHDVPLELVLVEWNPPPERPRLAEALQWPRQFGAFEVRVIEVPPEVHARYEHADSQPLYQMIAKNVGIRRAHGRFVLATNIDVLFSDEFFGLLSARAFRPGRMYRLDRYDVASEVPVDAPVQERLAYCESHVLRVNAREGTFATTPDGSLVLAPEDIVSHDSGIHFGKGWYGPEQYFGRLFRWAANEAEITLRPSVDATGVTLELEPGPGTAGGPFRLQWLGERGEVVGESEVAGKTAIRVRRTLPAGSTSVLRLRVIGGGLPVARDPRILNFRTFRCKWEHSEPDTREALVVQLEHSVYRRILGSTSQFWDTLRRGTSFIAELGRAKQAMRVGLPISPKTLERLQVRVEPSGLSFIVRRGRQRTGEAPRLCPAEGVVPQDSAHDGEMQLHTNACGDFTLLARADWFDLRGYPEFDLYSLHVDSIFCLAAHSAGVLEEVLKDPIRMYHIEHAVGSGWTPEGQQRLFQRLKAKGVPWIEYEEVVNWADAMRRLRAPMIFNRGNWGLADFELPERRLPASERQPGFGIK